ncbi:hypothetical protein SUDANB126_03617 [Streptomyces sp. enrichment culture]
MSVVLFPPGLSNPHRCFWVITVIIIVIVSAWWHPVGEVVGVCASVAGSFAFFTTLVREVRVQQRGTATVVPQGG